MTRRAQPQPDEEISPSELAPFAAAHATIDRARLMLEAHASEHPDCERCAALVREMMKG